MKDKIIEIPERLYLEVIDEAKYLREQLNELEGHYLKFTPKEQFDLKADKYIKKLQESILQLEIDNTRLKKVLRLYDIEKYRKLKLKYEALQEKYNYLHNTFNRQISIFNAELIELRLFKKFFS